MLQRGRFEPGMTPRNSGDPNQSVADYDLDNRMGTIARARSIDPHSATAQFFINAQDNGFLDHTAKNAEGWGYCVFGKVVDGLDTVNKIRAVRTTMNAGHQDVPFEDVIIEKAEVLEDA